MGKDLKGKELGSGIRQKDNGRYEARYFDRFGKRKSVYGSTLSEVKAKYAEALANDKKRLNVVDIRVTLDEWFEQWLLVYKSETVRKNTIKYYKHVYKKIISPELGKQRISEITQLQIQGMINRAKKKGYEWETQNKVRVLMIDMFNRAMEDDFLVKNPAKGVRTASVKPTDERRVLTTEEQAYFFEAAAGTFYANLFMVAVNTGLRPGELFALTESDIDWNNKNVSVTKTLLYEKFEEDDDEGKTFHIGPPKTKESVRKVPLNKFAITALKRQIVQKHVIARRNIKNTEFPDLLFTTKYNTPLNATIYNDAINRIVAEINLMRDDLDQMEKFSGHTFRHTFATRCIEAGVKPKVLQSYLGHATLQMTMDLYVHTTDEHKQEEIMLLENELDKIEVSDLLIDEKYKANLEQEKNVIAFACGVKMG